MKIEFGQKQNIESILCYWKDENSRRNMKLEGKWRKVENENGICPSEVKIVEE